MVKNLKAILRLQLLQKQHDHKWHQDIFFSDYQKRMLHYVLHYAKYVGRLSEDQKLPTESGKTLQATCTDAFIITLSASDALNLNLDERMEGIFGRKSKTVMGYGDYARKNPMMPKDLREWFLKSLAKPTGKMSKALESFDHMEEFGYRQALNDGVVDITRAVIIGANHMAERFGYDLVDSTKKRWKEIEHRRIL